MSTTTGVGAFTECLKNSAKGKKTRQKYGMNMVIALVI